MYVMLARMPANFRTELVGCFGQPVAENPTGAMQEAAFQALGLNWRYLTVEVPPDRLRDAMLGVRAFGMRGASTSRFLTRSQSSNSLTRLHRMPRSSAP